MKNSLDLALPLVKEQWGKKSREALWRADPVLWAEEVAGIRLWSKQREFAYSVRDNRATAVAAGHGVGKTFGAALLCAWWVDVHPTRDVFIASTAPSQPQVSLLWDNIRTIKANIEDRYNRGLIDHKLPGYITGDNAWKLDDGFKIGEGRKPPDNKSDVAFQGRHAPFLLAIADEGVGVPAGFLDALGNIATGRQNRQLVIANPTDPTSAMAKIWRENNPQWTRLHISVMDAPTIKPEEGFDANEMADRGMAGQEYIDQKLDEYGSEDDPRYIARVLGQWAFDAGNNMFSEEELAKGRDCVVLPDPARRPVLGLDVARGGKDASVIYMAQWGEVWECDDRTGKPIRGTGRLGIRLRYLDSWKKAPLFTDPQLVLPNPGTANRAHSKMLETGAIFLNFDASGMGGAIIDGLAFLNDYTYWRHGYLWFEVFGQSTRDVDRRQYENARAEQYFRLKTMLSKGELDLDPDDETLQEDLRGIIYEYTSQGRIKIEAKDDMKKRGVKSPDFADAAWYACYDIEAFVNQPTDGKHLIDPADMADVVAPRADGYTASV